MIIDQPGTINQDLVLRERTPADYGWTLSARLPAVVPVTGSPPVHTGDARWSVSQATLKDRAGARPPACHLTGMGLVLPPVDASVRVLMRSRIKAQPPRSSSGLAEPCGWDTFDL